MDDVLKILNLTNNDQQNSGPVAIEGISQIESRSWDRMRKVFRKHFLCAADANTDLSGEGWAVLPGAVRKRVIDALRDNPRFGPDFGLIPKELVYSTGETFCSAVKRKTIEGTWL